MWRIIENLIDDEEDGPVLPVSSDYRPEFVGKLNEKFRLLDGDDGICFVGYSDNDSSFAPLDQLGRGYGCVGIEYLDDTGTWLPL